MKVNQAGKATITIGIPAFNEERNIRHLLDSIFMQVGNFDLERIVVLNDGSTDKTAEIINDTISQGRRIELVHDEERRGKAYRLNQIFSSNTSDWHLSHGCDCHQRICGKIYLHTYPAFAEWVGD